KVYVGKASHIDFPCVRGSMFALDADTGQQVWQFDVLPENVCSNNAQKACSSSLDCAGGACVPYLVCRADSGPQPQQQRCLTSSDCTAPATCQRPLGGAIVSSPTIDEAAGVMYVSTGDCVGFGAAGFANSLVALDARTGALRWSFRALPQGDLGDFDFI